MAGKKESPEVALGQEDKQLLKDTENTTNLIREDVEDLDRKADYTHMTLEQLAKDINKLHREHNEFRLEMRKMISREIEKEVRPLVATLEKLTADKKRFIYVKSKKRILDIPRLMGSIIKKTWHLIKP
jgi:archaellum component FlaC